MFLPRRHSSKKQVKIPGGGGGTPHMKRMGKLVENFELKP